MTVAPELVWLIERLRRAPSRRQRVRLLLEGWRTLRDLSPADRLLVARELGIDGAEQLVEEIAERRGSSSEEILRALHLSDESDTAGVGGVMRGLVDPSRRGSTIDRLLGAASTWVADLDTLKSEEQSATEDQLPPTRDQVDEESELDETLGEDLEKDSTLPPLPPRPPEVKEVGAVVEPPVDVVAELELAPETAASLNEEAEPDSVELEDGGAADDSEPSSGVVAPEGVEEPAAQIPPSVSVEPVTTEQLETAKPTPIRAVDVNSVVGALAASRSLCGRLGELARTMPALAGAGVQELHTVIESFQEGWARRRALEAMLRSGLPDGLVEALALVGYLDRQSDRMWALTALASTRDLSAEDKEALLAAADTPAVRRRLEIRLRQRAALTPDP